MAINQPAGVQLGSGVGRQFVSDLSLLKPQYYDKFVEKYGNQNYTQLLEMIGLKAVVPGREFFHFESYGKLHSSIKITASTTTSVTNAGVTVTLTAGSHYNSGTQSPIRVGEVVEAASSGVQYKITVVGKGTAGAHTATIVPLKNASSTLAAGEILLFRGVSEAGEASTAADTLANLTEKKIFTTTEIREDYKITDRAKIEEIYLNFEGGSFYTYKGLDEAVRRFMNNKEFKLLFGSDADNISGTVGSKGLIPQIEAGGQVYQYDTVGNVAGFGIEDFHNLVRQIDFNGGAQEYHFLMDSYLRTAVDDALFAKYQNGAIVWANAGGSQDVAVKYGFDSIKIDGVTFHMKKYLPFNSDAIYGQSLASNGNKYDFYGALIPMKEGRDAQSGDKIPAVRIVSNEVESGKEVKVWETGALAKVPTSDKMELNVHHMAYCGLQVFAANQFLVVKK